jgi:hypothetical protein
LDLLSAWSDSEAPPIDTGAIVADPPSESSIDLVEESPWALLQHRVRVCGGAGMVGELRPRSGVEVEQPQRLAAVVLVEIAYWQPSTR